MNYLSLFSGIGGFERGIQQAYETNFHSRYGKTQTEKTTTPLKVVEKCEQGMGKLGDNADSNNRPPPVCIGYSEIDKYATQIYSKHFPTHTNYGDITKINADELPDFDLLVGGFPCQAFSIAGKRRGFEDTRGTLFFDIARILRAKQPRLFLLENVKGLLSHDNGNTFKTIISTLTELGYDLQWQVLNSKNNGVPQNRERIFIVGHLRGTSRPKVFPIGSTDKEVDGNPEIRQLNQPTHSNDRFCGIDGITPTLNTMQGGRRQPKIVGGLQGHQIAKDDGIAPCLTTAMGQGGGQTPIVWSKEIRIRRLTPKECERLQGFPDGWTEGISDTQRYKTLGNAVTVNVIQAIMERLLTPSHPKENN